MLKARIILQSPIIKRPVRYTFGAMAFISIIIILAVGAFSELWSLIY